MTIYTYDVVDTQGQVHSLEEYQDQVLLIVNTASRCGLAQQMHELEDLHKNYLDQGFQVLAFPCGQFLNQEPLEGEELLSYCQSHFDVSFPIFEKIKVNGSQAHPLYDYLKEATDSGPIKWNYTKFLVDRTGQAVRCYGPMKAPASIASDIEALL